VIFDFKYLKFLAGAGEPDPETPAPDGRTRGTMNVVNTSTIIIA